MFAITRGIGAVLAACALAGTAIAEDQKPETRLGEEGFESPPATLAQMDWLVGQWVGEGIQGAPAMESWLPPMGGTMVGTFVQETADGAIMFSEHMYIVSHGGTLALKLKHFNDDLTGWETKDEMLTFRLVGIEPCAAYFNALTLRCADPEKPGEGLVAAVRMKSDKPEPQELVFTFRPAPRTIAGSGDCDGTTYAINQCLAAVRDRAKAREKRYFEAALGGRPAAARPTNPQQDFMRSAQAAAEEMRSKECGAVYEQWREGSIRNAMALRCEIRLIDQRTHDIWRNWLTYQDSSEPVLPEPVPSH